MKAQKFTISFLNETIPCEFVTNTDRALETLSEVDADGVLGLDTETAIHTENKNGALDPHCSYFRLLQLSDNNKVFVYDMNYVDKEIFRPFLLKRKFTGHNSVFDLRFFINSYEPKTLIFPISFECTLIMSKLLHHARYAKDSEARLASLAVMVKKVLGVDISKKLQNSAWGNEVLTYEQVEYAAYDPICSLRLYNKLQPLVYSAGMGRVYEVMRRLQHPLAMADLRGVAFDSDKHTQLCKQWAKNLFTSRDELCKLMKVTKINSTTIRTYLEKTLDEDTLAVWDRTDTGKLKADAHVFADYSHLDIVKPVLNYSKYEKLTSTYGLGFQDFVNTRTKRIHSSINIAGARTGRLSSNKPNMQNCPRDGEFRQLFTASEGYKLIVADFSQIEVRVAAEISQDPMMLHVYREGLDIYKFTASDVFKKDYDSIDKDSEERTLSKSLTLGLLFGLGARGFVHYVRKGSGLELELSRATELVNAFFRLYKGYRRWQLFQASKGEQKLHTRSVLGKIRRLEPGNTYGVSMNHPIQATAAEIISISLYNMWKSIAKQKLDCYITLTVHDEIILECVESQLEIAKKSLERAMTNAYLEVFPNGITRKLVKAEEGMNWYEAK